MKELMSENVVEAKKLKDETIGLLNKFFTTVSATKSAVAVEERRVISTAYNKMTSIRRDLARKPPDNIDVAYVTECRSKIERQISDICNKLSNLTVKDSYRRHLHHFKTSPATTSQIFRQLKRKASTQQPNTGRLSHICSVDNGRTKQTSIKAQLLQQDSITEEKNSLEKLILEEKDYDETARFIETSLRMRTTKEDRDVLCTAYENFIRVYMKQHNLIRSIEQDETKGKDLNVSHMINNHRSIIVKELSDVYDKVSNLTIKEAYLHHLDEFKTGAKPKKYTQRFINQKESPEIFFRMKGGLGSGSSKSLNRIAKKPHIYEDLEEDEDEDDFHDHNKCIEEELERNFPRFGRIGNWDPIYEGKGADLLHAPINHSVKQEEDDYENYHIMMMREVFKSRDIHPKRRVALIDLFDF